MAWRGKKAAPAWCFQGLFSTADLTSSQYVTSAVAVTGQKTAHRKTQLLRSALFFMYFVDKTLFFISIYEREKKKVVGVFEALNGQRNLGQTSLGTCIL